MPPKDFPVSISANERTPLVECLLKIIAEQQETIKEQRGTIKKLETKLSALEQKVGNLEENLKEAKKLKGKPKIRPSTLNDREKPNAEGQKRAGSDKRSKKDSFVVDEERIIEPEETLPEGSKFNGYRVFDVQDLLLERHNIRLFLAEYVTLENQTIVGKVPSEYQGHFGATLSGFVLYQNHQCRVPQPLILEELREFGIDISAGQVNRLLIENKASFHQEQSEVLAAGLSGAVYIHTDDTGARHQGQNGYCTVIGNDLFAYFKSTASKSRNNFLRILRGAHSDYVLNAAGHQYLKAHSFPKLHFAKLPLSSASLADTDEAWRQYLEKLEIKSFNAVKLVSEAALLGSAIEHGLSPDLVILSDGARQFAILTHALCWVHRERGMRRLSGETQQQRQNLEDVQEALWAYYRQLRAFQDEPSMEQQLELSERFDVIFSKDYPEHESLNQAMQQFRMNKEELLRVLDIPEVPLHTNEAETDIREFVTRRKISGGTRHEDGRRARDTFTGLKKTCRKLAISFWQYLLSRLKGDRSVPFLPDVIRAKVAEKEAVLLAAA